jgi:hypothetical protein
MGAAISVSVITNNIYLSYDYRQKNSVYIRALQNELKRMDSNIIYSDIAIESSAHLSSSDISFNMSNIMETTSYFIFCVSKDTIRSFYQAIEIDSALNANKHILYLMLDEKYTPLNNSCVKGIVGQKKWLPLYNDDTLIDVLNLLLELRV